jgi:hypothetical protein
VTPGARVDLRAKMKWTSIQAAAGLRLSYGASKRQIWDAPALGNSLQTLVGDFSDTNDVPIFFGEFTPSLLADRGSVTRYVDDLLTWIDGKGFSWVFYEYRDVFPPELRCMGLYSCPVDRVTTDQCNEATYVIDVLRGHL